MENRAQITEKQDQRPENKNREQNTLQEDQNITTATKKIKALIITTYNDYNLKLISSQIIG